MKRARIRITGTVQGVGFRPFVYRVATALGINGFCMNDPSGVVIEVAGDRIAEFTGEIRKNPPPMASIEGFVFDETEGGPLPAGFHIRESAPGTAPVVFVSPDIATCPECLAELFDAEDRRHLYPFINCTNCGPRYSIITGVPYDRVRTTMSAFTMCPACETEYHDPSDRRFHAQPNACAECGPKVWLTNGGREEGRTEGYEAIERAQALLREGRIISVKGLGGFHIACDASNDAAVERLRALKRNSLSREEVSRKPFAVMAPCARTAREFAVVTDTGERMLAGSIRPIVLMKKTDAGVLSAAVAPGSSRYGVMLPYTPLHHLLLNDRDGLPAFTALVMTSGNVADEPIVTDNAEALERLSGMADAFLLHDREIHMRVDDSIVEVDDKGVRIIRRARGFVPANLTLDGCAYAGTGDGGNGALVLAVGGHLKNTFCIAGGGHATMGPHIGDLENIESMRFYTETLANIERTFHAAPTAVAVDMHPDYMSTRIGRDYAREHSIPCGRVIEVQHHHAHVAACMAEHRLSGQVVGVAFDGTGYGGDGTVWGGEFLVATRGEFKRMAHLDRRALPGGDRAVREPWRSAVAHISAAFGAEDAAEVIGRLMPRIDPARARTVVQMMEQEVNTPMTSSAGRLFDAVSSLLGLCDVITFEGEAAIALEEAALRHTGDVPGPYPYDIIDGDPVRVDTSPLIRAVVSAIDRDASPELISARFHATVADIICAVSGRLCAEAGITDVVLTGGVFQNTLLTGLATRGLRATGLDAYTHQRVPTNDGGISFGQAVVALERLGNRGI